jgi:hypothetical protein
VHVLTAEQQFTDLLEGLRVKHERLVELARNKELHWVKRMRALKKAEDIYQEWRRIRKAAQSEGILTEEALRISFDSYRLRTAIFEGHEGELGVDVSLLSPRLRYRHGRALEKKATSLDRTEKKMEAGLVLEEAKDAYHSLVDEEFRGTIPYKRLAIIHRSLGEHQQEKDVSSRALAVAHCTENQGEWFKDRISQAEENMETGRGGDP